MRKKKQLEKPFEYLRRKDGSAFLEETVKNWYKARAYVLEKLKDITIGPGSDKRLHVVVQGDSPLMLSVARQVALSAHYVNFEETTGRNKTLITIVSKTPNLIDELRKEEYMCNLPDYCKHAFVDIELQVVDDWQGGGEAVVMTEDELKSVLGSKPESEIFSVDTRKAVLVNRMYSLGVLIDNLPAEDIHCTDRYAMALDVFQHDLLKEPLTLLVDDEKWRKNVISVKNGLSNVFCADCFESRVNGMRNAGEWAEYNEVLSKSEHSRWVVEKLIMGFRPLSAQEHVRDEQLFGKAQKRYRSQLKTNPEDPAHIDLCSYSDLRRISPGDMKFDSFLMLAIPEIMKVVD